MNKYLKESVLWALILLPCIYLAVIWNSLPAQVPTHFDVDGMPNDWSDKITLQFIVTGMGIGIYFLMLLVPVLDPKKKIQEMGDKYYSLRFMITLFISLLSVYMVYMSKTGSIKNPNILFALLGALFAMFGNYFQTVRPNYFIGIRTPWTLENENVWKKTHRLGGRLWMAGGILIALLCFMISDNRSYEIIFFILICIMVIVPVVFSYTEFQKEKKMLNK